MRLFNLAVVDQLKTLGGELFTIDVPAAREDSVGNKLIPLPTSTSFRNNKRLILFLRLNESKCVDKVDFSRSSSANLSIDVDLK
jgi:hypothetical protein